MVPLRFLGDVVITNEEPDWAEKITALRQDLGPNQEASDAARIMRRTWEGKLAVLGTEFERRRRKQPAWSPPSVEVEFSTSRY